MPQGNIPRLCLKLPRGLPNKAPKPPPPPSPIHKVLAPTHNNPLTSTNKWSFIFGYIVAAPAPLGMSAPSYGMGLAKGGGGHGVMPS